MPNQKEHEYVFSSTATISMHTKVRGTMTLEEAMQIAKSRGNLELCYQCSTGEVEEQWVTTGELDGDPALSPLVEVTVDDKALSPAKLKVIAKKWGGAR